MASRIDPGGANHHAEPPTGNPRKYPRKYPRFPKAWASAWVGYAADDDRRQAERHLVRHQQPGRAGQRVGDREHLLLAARQQPGLPLLERPQRGEARERAVEVGRGDAVEPEVLGHGQPGEQPAVGRHVRDAHPGPRGRRRPSPPTSATT
jgi:hypothetical protein